MLQNTALNLFNCLLALNLGPIHPRPVTDLKTVLTIAGHQPKTNQKPKPKKKIPKPTHPFCNAREFINLPESLCSHCHGEKCSYQCLTTLMKYKINTA